MPTSEHAGAILEIDLDAVAANWRLLRDKLESRNCAAVVKADAYGLGVAPVAQTLWDAGARTFFVALVDEGLALRQLLPGAEILVLNGAPRECEADLRAAGLVPVLNTLGDVEAWKDTGGGPACLHVDTGMNRLGLPHYEAETLLEEPDRLDGIDVVLLMSHLACADDPHSHMNEDQLSAFREWVHGFHRPRTSFANSSGLFLGPGYHFDLGRPGISIYGGNPHPESPNPMAQVVRLRAKILQVRDVDTPETVGYGATYAAREKTKIATLPVGYADGYLRSLSNSGGVFIGDVRLPIVGRVSMDLTTVDISNVSETLAHPGAMVDVIGPMNPIDDVARAAGTISYEILTGLGRRYQRVYSGGGA